MAHLKTCGHCKGKHRKRRAYLRCKRQHSTEKWS